jgi:hypothetical protein
MLQRITGNILHMKLFSYWYAKVEGPLGRLPANDRVVLYPVTSEDIALVAQPCTNSGSASVSILQILIQDWLAQPLRFFRQTGMSQ